MVPSPDVYDAGRRRAALDSEIGQRERDGWRVTSRKGFEAMLVHEVTAPWHLAIAGFVLGIVGGSTGDFSRQRHLHLEAFEDGRIFRATVGDVPRSWSRKRPWEVPDGWATDRG